MIKVLGAKPQSPPETTPMYMVIIFQWKTGPKMSRHYGTAVSHL